MTNQSKRINYMDPSFEMDFTNLERLPTTTGIPLIDRLNTELNAQSERLEDIFIDIACTNIDNPRKCAFYKELKGSKKFKDTGISAEDKEDICNLWESGKISRTELQEMFGLKRNVLQKILNNSTYAVGKEDDFDADNADYLAIQEEVNNNPRD